MNLKNCPREFYLNCSHALVHCKSCIAGGGRPTMKLQYKPINDIGAHPASTGKDKKKQQRLREAKLAEKRAAESIARMTLASGAARGDGDYLVLDSMRVEHKDKSNQYSITVSKAEITKGWLQDIQMYAITYTHPVTLRKRTAYVMDEELLAELLGAYNERVSKVSES